MNHDEVSQRFNHTFGVSHRTVLIGGAPEPIFLPGCGKAGRAIIRYREDFTLSALHEVAHWCIASAGRRRCRDYGYWYIPPPRDATAQTEFFAVEARVQALESLFAAAIGARFVVSADDFGSSSTDFARAVASTACRIEAAGLPPRAERFREALYA